MLVVGLTGNIGSGKSTVASLIAARGVRVIDSDVLAREAVAPGTTALDQIIARWGRGMRAPDGSLDRGALRRIVFANPDDRMALDAIVHPDVARRRDALLATARGRGERVVVSDIPLLFEAGLAPSVDVVLLVDAPEELRLARLVRDRALTPDDARAMIAAQMPAARKRPHADFVIDNEGSQAALAAQVDEVWRAIEARAAGASP
jgi:dephospho-CoA kinase